MLLYTSVPVKIRGPSTFQEELAASPTNRLHILGAVLALHVGAGKAHWTRHGSKMSCQELHQASHVQNETRFTLWWTNIAIFSMAIEIVDFPMNNCDFPWLFVCSPEGQKISNPPISELQNFHPHLSWPGAFRSSNSMSKLTRSPACRVESPPRW